MSGDVSCEKCGAIGRRQSFHPCPGNGWWWTEARVDGVEVMLHVCSTACRDALWQAGPGPRWTMAEVDANIAAADAAEAAFLAKWDEEMLAYDVPGGRWANKGRREFIRALLADAKVTPAYEPPGAALQSTRGGRP